MAGQQHEIEPVLDLVDAILNGDPGHARCSLMEIMEAVRYVTISPAKCKLELQDAFAVQIAAKFLLGVVASVC